MIPADLPADLSLDDLAHLLSARDADDATARERSDEEAIDHARGK